jgi:FKBP-type peptidyl-prolyl cis-trans isomerase
MPTRQVTVSLVAAVVLVFTACAAEERSEPKGTIAPVDVAAPPADAVKTSTGLFYRVLVGGGSGRHPGPNSQVTVHYTGWTTDGTIVEGAPRGGGDPVTLDLSERPAGWREGLAMMVPGEKRRFWMPPALAYAGHPGKPQGMMVFDIELLKFTN